MINEILVNCTNFKYGAAKIVPTRHLAHIDFRPVAESVSCVENSHAKNNFVFH